MELDLIIENYLHLKLIYTYIKHTAHVDILLKIFVSSTGHPLKEYKIYVCSSYKILQMGCISCRRNKYFNPFLWIYRNTTLCISNNRKVEAEINFFSFFVDTMLSLFNDLRMAFNFYLNFKKLCLFGNVQLYCKSFCIHFTACFHGKRHKFVTSATP